MTTERKLLYAFGALIIAGMIAVAAFSLGVYIGEQGWTLQAPSVAGPGQGEPRQPQPADRPAQPRPDLIGVVRHVAGDSLGLETQEGLRSVLMDDETRVVRLVDEEEEPAQWGDLQRGARIAVFGEFGGDGRTLTAQLVVILPSPAEEPQPPGEPAQSRPNLIGMVRHVTGDSLEVETREGLRSVLLNDETRVVRRVGEREEPAQQRDLQQGVLVAVFGGDGRTLTARLVVILPPSK